MWFGITIKELYAPYQTGANDSSIPYVSLIYSNILKYRVAHPGTYVLFIFSGTVWKNEKLVFDFPSKSLPNLSITNTVFIEK